MCNLRKALAGTSVHRPLSIGEVTRQENLQERALMRRFILGSKNGMGGGGRAGRNRPCRPAFQTGPLTAENNSYSKHLGEWTWNTRAAVASGE